MLHIDLTGPRPRRRNDASTLRKGRPPPSHDRARRSGRDRFDEFLQDYFNTFRFQSITTAQFEEFLRAKLFGDDSDSIAASTCGSGSKSPGSRHGSTTPQSARLDAVDRAAAGWVDQSISTEKLGAADWSTQEWLRFLRMLPRQAARSSGWPISTGSSV